MTSAALAAEYARALGRPAVKFPVTGKTASGLLVSGHMILHGWALQNTGGAAGTVLLFDGADANGTPVAPIALAAAGTDKLWIGSPGLELEIGCYLQLTTVTLAGSVWLTPLWDYPGQGGGQG